MMQAQVNSLMATADAARIIGVTPAMVRIYANTGKLPIAERTPGGIRLFRRRDVEAFRRQREERRE